MARLLTILSFIIVILLFPPATLALISNNAVPGDLTYPIKRGLEDVIFSVASVNPVTKAWFSAARSDRRFQEISTLAAQGKKTTQSLNDLVEQTKVTADQIGQVSDPTQKAQLVEQLSQSIDKYDQGLAQISSTQNQQSSTESPTSAPTAQATKQPQQTSVPTSSPTATSLPTSSPRATPAPTSVPTHSPTPTSRPTPSPTPTPSGTGDECDQITDEIQRARCELEEIKGGLENANSQPASNTVQSTPTPTPEENHNSRQNTQRAATPVPVTCTEDSSYCDPNAHPAQLIHKHGGTAVYQNNPDVPFKDAWGESVREGNPGCIYLFDKTGQACH